MCVSITGSTATAVHIGSIAIPAIDCETCNGKPKEKPTTILKEKLLGGHLGVLMNNDTIRS